MPEAVRLERGGDGLAVATFDSPPLNLVDSRMLEGLQVAIEEIESDLPRALASVPRGRRSRAASTFTSSRN